MVGAILKSTKSSFQKGMTFCRSINVKEERKLLAFIFEHPSYTYDTAQWERVTGICLFCAKSQNFSNNYDNKFSINFDNH